MHWQSWLGSGLQSLGYKVNMPELPDSDHPDRQGWLSTAKQSVKSVNLQDLIIVGHSLGVTTALDFIEQADQKINGLVSVSGFAEPYGAELNEYFLAEKSIDFSKINSNLVWSKVFYGDDDPYVSQDALKRLADSLDVSPHIITNGGHLNTEAGFTEFPQLIEAIEASS